MKYLHSFLFLFSILLLISCDKKNTDYQIQIINPYGLERSDEPIVLRRESIDGTAENPNKYPHIANSDYEVYPYQLDDLDGDGEWDELFMLINIDPKDTLIFHIEYRDEIPNIAFKKRANIRFGEKNAPYGVIENAERLPEGKTEITSQIFQMEGPAWENDVVGFRNYYDARNGMDIFGKQTTEMALDSSGIKGQNYHELDDWGMDILKVGNSLGAGAIALYSGDSIYRWSPSGKGTYRLIADGPLRAMFDLNFEGWQVGDSQIDLNHRISIWGGANVYRSEVSAKNLPDSVSLLTGIVNIHSDSLHFGDFEKQTILATHDKQAENKAYLGMALMLDKDDYIKHFETPKTGTNVTQTYAVNLSLSEENPTVFYFYAGWENQDQRFQDLNFFLSSVKKSTDLLRNPLIVK
ncbi:MAG: DUF4861 domain-containing protein [Cyclobacteriaceae bacterium]